MECLFIGLPGLARFLIGFYFIFFGIWNIYHWFSILETMTQKGIPHSYLWLSGGILWQVILGTMIMFNIYIKLAAMLLIPFTLIAIIIFNQFWIYKEELRRLHFILFVTNLTVTMGALLLLITNQIHS